MIKRHEEPVMVTRSSLPPLEEYVEMLKPIWDSAWLTNMGEYHETLKEKLKTYLKTCLLYTSKSCAKAGCVLGVNIMDHQSPAVFLRSLEGTNRGVITDGGQEGLYRCLLYTSRCV